jgi:hypothetical protein
VSSINSIGKITLIYTLEKMRRGLTILVFTFLNITSAFNQSIYVGGLFPTIDHTGIISNKLEYSFYYFGALPLINFKNPDIKKDPKLLLFYSEQGLTYKAAEQLSLSGSYVFQIEDVTKGSYLNEHRVHIQASYRHLERSLTFRHRLRFDNRFIYNRQTGKSPYTHRLRYLFKVDFPIKTSKSDMYFTAYEEAFFNTFKKPAAVYAENWAYAAIGKKLGDKNKIETGFLYITWNTGSQNWFHQYYIQFTWISEIELKKDKKEY